jgi:hypothetical protein
MTIVAAALIGGIAGPAYGCRIHSQLKLDDIRYADIVVVGRVSNYRKILDPEARTRWTKMYGPWKEPDSFMSDYAMFDVTVDEVLTGDPPRTFTVEWDNSTFGEPETMAAGPFLIALRKPASPAPPLNGPSATIMPTPGAAAFSMLQAPCSSPFMFGSDSPEAASIRQRLRGG